VFPVAVHAVIKAAAPARAIKGLNIIRGLSIVLVPCGPKRRRKRRSSRNRRRRLTLQVWTKGSKPMVVERLDRNAAGPEELARADLRDAYDRGRADERASRRRHPVGMTLMAVAALVGVIVLALAAVNGSFTRAGGVVDQNLNTAVNRAEPQVREAASQAGASLREAGQSVRRQTDGVDDQPQRSAP
jgi:hypothetical protein